MQPSERAQARRDAGGRGADRVPVLLFGRAVLDWLSSAVPDPRFGSLLGAALLFFVPTFFSGMVSPYAVRLLVQDARAPGGHAGQLYFVRRSAAPPARCSLRFTSCSGWK